MQYFIDFENTHDEGLISISPLPDTDTVYLFYTAQTPKINLDTLAAVNAVIRYIKVPAGKQSLDQHLITFLGYAIAMGGKEDGYVVVSNDNGYDPIIAFWCGRGYRVSKKQKPKKPEPVKKQEQAKKPEQQKKQDFKRSESGNRTAQPVKQEPRTEAPREPVKEQGKDAAPEPMTEAVKEPAVPAEGIAEILPAAAAEQIAELTAPQEPKAEELTAAVTEPEKEPDKEPEKPKKAQNRRTRNRGRKQEAAKAPSELEPQEPEKAPELPDLQEQTEEPAAPDETEPKPAVAEETKPAAETASVSVLEQPAAAEPEEPAKTPVENTEAAEPGLISLLLAEAGADSRAIRDISALVEKHAEDKHEGKSLIYRGMVKKFGQKRGLSYYNVIKKEL